MGSARRRSSPDDFEYDRKGSVVVAETEAELVASAERARVLAGLGVHGEVLDADALRREEPHAAHDLPGGVLYPGDAQLEPRLATAALVRAAVALGAELSLDTPIDADRARALRPRDRRRDGRRADHRGRRRRRRRRLDAGSCCETAACTSRSRPRKGQIVVLERSPVVFRRKLSEAGYVAAVEARRRRAADRDGRRVHAVAAPRCSAPRRQHVGFDREVDISVAGAIAAPRRALLPDPATTPARCASTPACAR